jgi:hypothetical protein
MMRGNRLIGIAKLATATCPVLFLTLSTAAEDGYWSTHQVEKFIAGADASVVPSII